MLSAVRGHLSLVVGLSFAPCPREYSAQKSHFLILLVYVVPNSNIDYSFPYSGAAKLTYRAFYDKSMKFGTIIPWNIGYRSVLEGEAIWHMPREESVAKVTYTSLATM